MYYTLIHNKDVALKGFLRGCRPTRLNHVTLVFTVFLFYASSSASTLAYTTWYITSRCQCNRPNPNPACTSSLGFSRLYILMLWLMCVTQIHNSAHAFFQIWVYSITQLPRKLHCCLAATSLISQASRTTHLTDLCKSSLRLKKQTTQACSSVSRKENPEIRSPESVPRAPTRHSCLRKTPTRRLRFPDFQIVLVHMRRHDGLFDHRSAY